MHNSIPHKISKFTYDGPFTLVFSAQGWCVGYNPVRHPRKGKALQPDRTMPLKRGQEQPFTTKEHGLETAGPFDVIRYTRGEGDQASGVNAEFFALEFFLYHGSTCMHKGHAISA